MYNNKISYSLISDFPLTSAHTDLFQPMTSQHPPVNQSTAAISGTAGRGLTDDGVKTTLFSVKPDPI